MSCSLNDNAADIAMQAEIFDSLRNGAEVCYLLKRDGQTKKFVAVAQLAAGWFVSWDKFREAFGLRYATDDTDFADKLAQSSFVGYGLPDGDGVVDVYEISPDKRDKTPPTANSPSWKVYVQRFDKERFTIE